MNPFALVRGILDVVALSTVGAGGAGYSTARWQDKSRSLRLGRSGGERWHIRHLARGATAHDSLPSRITSCSFTTARTSCTP
jgi:hypothetical protein